MREETAHRFRLIFVSGSGPRSLLISIDPRRPWMGRPLARWPGPRRHPGPLARSARAARGVALRAVRREPLDRVVRLELADGSALVAELVPHRANLVLLDAAGRVVAAARAPRSARERLSAGRAYAPPDPPPGARDPWSRDAAAWERLLREAAADEGGRDPLAEPAVGLGPEAAALVRRGPGDDPAALARRLRAALDDLAAGRRAPALALPPGSSAEPGPLLAAAEAGDPSCLERRLLPWAPGDGAPDAGAGDGNDGAVLVRLDDPAATAGLHHEALDRLEAFRRRERDLLAILADETRRAESAAGRARSDAETFRDPERHRRTAEALLAGLAAVRIEGTRATVPDPYDPDGPPRTAELKPGESPAQAAERLFAAQRRAERGRAAARARADERSAAAGRLHAAARAYAEGPGPDALGRVEAALRREGVPVGLPGAEGPAPRGRGPGPGGGAAASRGAGRRPPGIRILTSRDGLEILVGRTARDNHLLTFKVAGPEDLWFHALGVPGAHVVVRSGGRGPRGVPEATRREAAAAAAWFSEARGAERVDVQWTRRKYVRRPRGAAPGTVTLKKFETLRVRPGVPAEGGADGT